METLTSTAIIQRIRHEDGDYWLAFAGHDGYFRLPDAANAPEIRQKIESAHAEGRKITFSYDRNLTIVEIES